MGNLLFIIRHIDNIEDISRNEMKLFIYYNNNYKYFYIQNDGSFFIEISIQIDFIWLCYEIKYNNECIKILNCILYIYR